MSHDGLMSKGGWCIPDPSSQVLGQSDLTKLIICPVGTGVRLGDLSLMACPPVHDREEDREAVETLHVTSHKARNALGNVTMRVCSDGF